MAQPAPVTPIEETLRALDDFVRSGLVRYIGCSNWAAWQIMKALGISDRLHLPRFATLQAYYSLAGRDVEREIVPLLESEGVGMMAWSPLAGGYLSGKFVQGDDPSARRHQLQFPPVDEQLRARVVTALQEVARRQDSSVAQVALSWLLHRRVVTSVIMGFKRLEQLEDNLAAADITLSDEDLKTLDRASALAPEYPAWMMQGQTASRRPAPFHADTKDKAE